MDSMILTDYIFLFVILVSTLFGFARGFLREVFTVLNIFLALAAAYFVYPIAVKFFAEHLEDEMWIQGSAAIGSFILSWVIIAIVNSFVIDAMKTFRGGFIDRLLGTALGLARGALMVIAVYLGATITVNAQEDDSKLPAWLKEAGSLNYIKVQSEYVVMLMPEKFQEFYKSQDSSLTEQLFKPAEGELSEEDTEKLRKLGFGTDHIQTMQKLLGNVDESLKIEDLNNFSTDTIKMLGEQAVEDEQTKDGGKVSNDELEELREKLQDIQVKDAW